MNDPSSSRYPIEKQRYLESVGKLLPHRIGQILEELGFRIEINFVQRKGVDLILFDDKNNIILVAEILNWSPYTMLSDKRKRWITSNLRKYGCKRLLIYTTMKNEYTLSSLIEAGIPIQKLDYQILPKAFFEFYKAKNQIEARVIDSRQTRHHIKLRILDYLESYNLLPVFA